MRTPILRPRLASLDVFASALLVALGATTQVGCASEVSPSDDESASGSGGAGGNGSPTSSGVGGSGNSSVASTGGGGTSTTSVASGTSTSVSTGVGGGGSGGCENPMPVLVNGQDTGFDLCEGGQYRRRDALECPTNYPDTNPCCGGCPVGQVCNTGGEIACTCVPACTNDSECPADQLCMCGPAAGQCVPAKCKTGADCAQGEECNSWDYTLGCLYLEFACTTPADTCGGDADCTLPNQVCAVLVDGHRECVDGGCAIGRPFLVGDEVRTAALARRSDWSDAGVLPDCTRIAGPIRLDLADAWEHIARMEHASIASFARFSLQLLGLGAPSDLVERTNRAMADETRHARAAFALASAYRGRPVGPGALRIDGALAADDLESIVRLVIREGCVGETIAAVEAGEAEARAEDPVVHRVLQTIAAEESDHSELAWRTLRWALESSPEICEVVLEEIAILEREISGAAEQPLTDHDETLLRHGVVTTARRAAIRNAVLRRAVLPCLRVLAANPLPAAA